VAQIAAIVALLTGILTLVFVVRPGWKPQAPADTGKMTMGEVSVKQAPFRRYLERLQLPAGTLAASYLRRPGALVEFHFELSGFKGKELPLTWELVDAKTNEAVDHDRAVSIKPSTNNDARTWFVWVPAKRTTRAYYVTVTVYQPHKGSVDVPLQDFDSPTFKGIGGA
jgi:hypothetical protein